MLLTLKYHIKEDYNIKLPDDNRKKADRYIKEYYDKKGNPYRKAFFTFRGIKPYIPLQGTHTEINSFRKQMKLYNDFKLAIDGNTNTVNYKKYWNSFIKYANKNQYSNNPLLYNCSFSENFELWMIEKTNFD